MTEAKRSAKQIVPTLSSEIPAGDMAAIFAALEKINHRMDKLESSMRKSMAGKTRTKHPSTEKFSVAEAIAEEIFGRLETEKACTFEPNDRPCDHCSMCSSRGF
jgi:hypothetical protein